MKVDAHGNKHSAAGGPDGGRFSGRVNAAPQESLTAGIATTSASNVLAAAFAREAAAAWERVRALRTPAVTALTALARDRYAGVAAIYLSAEIDPDTFEQYVSVVELQSRSGEAIDLEPADEEELNEIVRAVAENEDELLELPTAVSSPGIGTVFLPVPEVHSGDPHPVEAAFFSSVERGIFDYYLAGDALRVCAGRLLPDAQALIFQMIYDEDPRLVFDSVVFDAERDVDAAETGAHDDIDQIVFSMSGRGSTGEDIVGIEHVDSDTYIFELGS